MGLGGSPLGGHILSCLCCARLLPRLTFVMRNADPLQLVDAVVFVVSCVVAFGALACASDSVVDVLAYSVCSCFYLAA